LLEITVIYGGISNIFFENSILTGGVEFQIILRCYLDESKKQNSVSLPFYFCSKMSLCFPLGKL